jgi:hypothetical protein
MAVLAAALLITAVIAFGMSVRFGMLLGRRLDRALEERASLGGSPGEACATTADVGEAHRSAERTGPPWYRDTSVGSAGQEEMRRE